MLSACRDYEETNTLTYIEGVVLNRRVTHKAITLIPYKINADYELYIYNGIDSKWYKTNDSLYNALRPRDSISSYVITTTMTRKE